MMYFNRCILESQNAHSVQKKKIISIFISNNTLICIKQSNLYHQYIYITNITLICSTNILIMICRISVCTLNCGLIFIKIYLL